MRSELHEPGQGWLAAMAKPARRKAAPLAASIVDAALGDDSLTPVGARRDLAHPSASSVDATEAREASEGPLLKQLSQQLGLLEAQQQQIRRLLEQTEQRARSVTARIDR
jgi:hypothetical protein